MEDIQKKIQILLNLYKSKNLSKAELFNRELIQNYPKIILLYNILGLILTDQNRIQDAINCYEKGIKIDPKYSMIYNNLGTIYKSKKDYKKAESYFKKSIKLNQKIPEPQNNLGNLYIILNKYDEAIICFKSAININSNFFPSHYNLGRAYVNLGKLDDAKKYLKLCIKINPLFSVAHRALSGLIKYSKDSEHLVELKKQYEKSEVSDKQKIDLSFSLGKAYDDIEDYDNAYKYFAAGNLLRKNEVKFNLLEEKEIFEKIKSVFSYKLFNKFKFKKIKKSVPIFIIGMPRSGTTLVEQILSSHPSVYGGDELNFLPDLVGKYFFNNKNSIAINNIEKYNEKEFKKIGDEYISKLNKISNNSKRVTDKLPINFKWIGVIKLILPNSKIIHCTRNPKDNSLSIFKNYFSNTKLNFAYSEDDIYNFYNLYYDLMIYWKKVLPNFVFDFEYENIIKNPKKEITNLLKVCELKWNDKCLNFHNNKRVIKTVSNTQARKKIYKSSVNSWKNYQNNLINLFNKLPN